MVSRDDILTNSERKNYSESYWKQEKVFLEMLEKYEAVSADEGFDLIIILWDKISEDIKK